MKLPSDHIFKLIQAMTSSEKRYFKRHYASEASFLTNLFDFINKMRSYDEEQVKSYFAKTKLSKNLKVYKVQLAGLLLKSLVSYHSKNSVHSKIRQGLEEVDILIEKQLFDIALSRIKRLKATCLEYEAFEYLFPILATELNLNSFYSANPNSHQTPTFQELEASLSAVQEILSLQRYSHQLSDIKNHLSTQALSPQQHQQYTQLLTTLEAKPNDDNRSFREQYFQYHVLSMIHRLVLNDPEKENHYKRLQIELLKSHPKISKAYPALYFASMHNFLSSCWKLKRFDALKEGIADIQQFIHKKPILERNKLFVYYLQILLLISDDLSKLEEPFEKEVMAHIKKYKQESDYLSNLIYLRFAIIHLALEHHKKVQFFLRRINDYTPTMSSAFGSLVQIIELISHYQSKDVFLVQNRINSLTRKRKKGIPKKDTLPDSILLFFQQLIKTTDRKQIVVLATEFESRPKFEESQELEKWLQEYLFYDWLRALIDNVPLKKQLTIDRLITK